LTEKGQNHQKTKLGGNLTEMEKVKGLKNRGRRTVNPKKQLKVSGAARGPNGSGKGGSQSRNPRR